MLISRKIAKATNGFLKTCYVILLLFPYLLASSNINSFHDLVHTHPTSELHATVDESDPCHISVYHQGRWGGCDHDTHLINEDKCSLCDSELTSTHVLFGFTVIINSFSALNNESDINPLSFKGFYSYSSSRAPPVL